MMKKYLKWLAALAAVMLLLPWLAVTFAKGDAGMAICFILFYAIDPLCCIYAGIAAGKDVKKMWSLPVLAPLLYLAGTWLLFDMGETAFIGYAAVYLVLGSIAMLARVLFERGKK